VTGYKQLIFSLLILLCSIQNIPAQNFTISGTVKDKSNGETAIGANVYIKELTKGNATNVYGFYSISAPKGNYTLVCSYLGYQTYEQQIALDKNQTLDIFLSPTAVTTEEVVINAKAEENIKSTQMSTIQLDIQQIKKLPAFMGEVDILKTIQLLPGVKSAGDGQTGFYVRGGGPDQNLILLDEAVVYNASHLMGFFSVFNGDAIKNVNLIKGGMPAQYGQRLSSVLDITMKEGNNQRYQVDGGIGLISSRFTIQGPIKKDTSSFIISARRTYIDAIIKPIFKARKSPFQGTSYYFYDLNTKFNYQINKKNRLMLSGYFGKDVFSFKDADAGFNIQVPWGNATASLRWNHIYNEKLFSNTSAIFSYYDFSLGAIQEDFEFKLFSGVRDYNIKHDFSYFPNSRHTMRFGVNYTFHNFIPTTASAQQGDVVFDLGKVIKLYCHEAHAYFGDDVEITENLQVHAGLRFGYFAQVGPFTRYHKNEYSKIVDTTYYGPGRKIKDYNGLEPRLSMRYKLGKSSSIKASYTYNKQYVHLASLSSVSLPTDVWMPSTDVIKPQIGSQYAIGYFQNLKDNMFESSVEVYYKDMKNLIEYKEGATPDDNVKDNPDNAFTFGTGRAYGGEFFIKKREGKFTGWIGYTLSWTTRTFPEINLGKTFFAKYDRRHDVSVVTMYELSPRWNFSLVWVYATGNTGTLPNSLYYFEQSVAVQYGERNSYRFKPYHRMDISAIYTPGRAKQMARRKKRLEERYARKGKDPATVKVPRSWCKHYETNWAFSVFNVYNRMNPYFLYFDSSGDITKGTFQVQAKQVSLFPVLPSVTWNFKF
jgi:hypothetical protein